MSINIEKKEMHENSHVADHGEIDAVAGSQYATALTWPVASSAPSMRARISPSLFSVRTYVTRSIDIISSSIAVKWVIHISIQCGEEQTEGHEKDGNTE